MASRIDDFEIMPHLDWKPLKHLTARVHVTIFALNFL